MVRPGSLRGGGAEAQPGRNCRAGVGPRLSSTCGLLPAARCSQYAHTPGVLPLPMALLRLSGEGSYPPPCVLGAL